MLALGIARDLGADHTPSVGLRRSSPEPCEPAPVDALDVERARTRAVVRAHTGDNVERQGSAPGLSLQNIAMGQRGRGPASRRPTHSGPDSSISAKSQSGMSSESQSSVSSKLLNQSAADLQRALFFW